MKWGLETKCKMSLVYALDTAALSLETTSLSMVYNGNGTTVSANKSQ